MAAQEKDTRWLNSLSHGQDAMEWYGFNIHLARSQDILKSASICMFGHWSTSSLLAMCTRYLLEKQVNGNKVGPIIDLQNTDWSATADDRWSLILCLPRNCVQSFHHSLMILVVSAKPTSRGWLNALVCLRSFQQRLALSS